MFASNVSLRSGEYGKYMGDVTESQVRGLMILTNQRLIFRPKAKGNSAQMDYTLEDMTKVSYLTNMPGFVFELGDRTRHEFHQGSRKVWALGL